MLPTFHGKGIENIARLNDSIYVSQVSYTAVDPPESFIAIKNYYLRPCCERRKQAVAFKLSRLAIRVVLRI